MANDGDTVKVLYTGTLEDGTIFDTSREQEPLKFIIGAGQMIPGFEGAVRGMQVGQTKTVTIPTEEAYGPHRDGLVMEIEWDKLPEDLEAEIGDRLQTHDEEGRPMVVVVTDVSLATITVDTNHPLAGKDLTFAIKLVEIK
ncbi:peptidylprolyl isomerase [Chloroflexota bacterium]